MKRTLVFAVFAVALSLAPGHLVLVQTAQDPQSKPLVFTHVTVIDAMGAPAKSDMTVVITGDRITEVGKSGKVRLPKDARVVDATGKFLIPGLWDMHVHLHRDEDLLLFIANGLTGVRVMLGHPSFHQGRKEIESGAALGPRMIIASPLLDGPKPVWPGSIAVSNETEGRKAVTKVKQEGADFVKVYSLLPREAYFAIADEAKKQGIPFAGHVPDSVSAAEASDAGQKSIEHLTGIVSACSAREEELRKGRADAFANLPQGQRIPSPARTRPLTRMMLETFSAEKAAALFARFKRNHTWQCPTLTVLRSTAFIDDPNFRNDPRLKYMPAQTRARWDPTTDFRFKEGTAEDYELARMVYKKQLELVGLMRRAGVEFLAGTDVANPYCFPGFSLHDELGLLVKAGLTRMEALQAATLNPARFLGREKDLGTVEKGKLADLVLLDADPLQDISNTQKINAVVVGGKLLPKSELQNMLANIEALASKNVEPTTAPKPLVSLTHIYMVLDAETYQAIANSEFLRNELGSSFETRTVRWPQRSFTGALLHFDKTFLEFHEPAGYEGSVKRKEGDAGIGLGVNRLSELDAIFDAFKKQPGTDPRRGTQNTLTRSGEPVAFYDWVVSRDDPASRLNTFVEAYHPEFFKLRGIQIPESGELTREALNSKRRTNQDPLGANVTGATLALGPEEAERIDREMAAIGYARTKNADSVEYSGPDFTLRVLPEAASKRGYKVISVKIGLRKEPKEAIELRFGPRSVLKIRKDKIAEWVFD